MQNHTKPLKTHRKRNAALCALLVTALLVSPAFGENALPAEEAIPSAEEAIPATEEGALSAVEDVSPNGTTALLGEEIASPDENAAPAAEEALFVIEDASAMRYEEILALLEEQSSLRKVRIGHSKLTAAEVLALRESFPEADIECDFRCFKTEYSTAAETAVITQKNATAEEIRTFLSVMTKLTRLEMFECRIRNSDLTPIIDEHPEISFGWTVNVIGQRIRNDVQVLSTLGKVHHKAEYYEILRYFPNLIALDLGHNQLGGVDFLRYLPNLDVLILVDNKLGDEDLAKIVEYAPNVRYLELWENEITDLSPLPGLTKLREINLYGNQVADLTPLTTMTWLERCFVHGNPYPKEQEQLSREALPNTVLNFEGTYPTAGSWRGEESHYQVLRRMFKFGHYYDLYAE